MGNLTYRVYVLRHQTPSSYGCFLGGDDEECNASALEPSLEFQAFLKDNLVGFGELFVGPSRDSPSGIVTEHVVCLLQEWPQMWELPNVRVRSAGSEIFTGADGVYYLNEDMLLMLDGEVLRDFFGDEHGRTVPALEAEVNRRLRRSCRHECRSIGLNATALREIMPRWMDAVRKKPPHDWTWKWLRQEVVRIAEDFQMGLRDVQAWFVYEHLCVEGVHVPPPFSDGAIITEVTEAAVDDLPGACEWLIRGQLLYGYIKLRMPEFETLRFMEEHEVFASRAGTLWIQDGRGVQLGEIAGDLMADRHGEIVPDLEEQAVQRAVDLIIDEVERRCPEAPFEEILQVVHDLVDDRIALGMWYKSVPELTEKALGKLDL